MFITLIDNYIIFQYSMALNLQSAWFVFQKKSVWCGWEEAAFVPGWELPGLRVFPQRPLPVTWPCCWGQQQWKAPRFHVTFHILTILQEAWPVNGSLVSAVFFTAWGLRWHLHVIALTSRVHGNHVTAHWLLAFMAITLQLSDLMCSLQCSNSAHV